MRSGFATGFAFSLLIAGCSSEQEREQFHSESVLQVEIPGTTDRTVTTSGDTVTKLFDVAGDWIQVSVDIAHIVQREGWQIESVNCVGTGNDVVAKRNDNGEWLLLESGAGERGAGIIVRPDPAQAPPSPFTVTGRCPVQLVNAANP